MKKRIVITGMGVVSCYGTNVDTFYEKLLQGVSGISEVTGVDLTDIPTKFGGQVRGFDPELFIDKKQARRVDPCIAFAVAAGKMAMQHAKLEVKDPTRAGVLIGSGMGGMHTYNANVEAMVKAGPKRVSPFFIPYVITNMGGAILAM